METSETAQFKITGDASTFDGVFVKEEGTDFYRFDSGAYYRSMSPEAQRNHDRRHKVMMIEIWMNQHIPWKSWPLLHLVYVFWICLMEEGIYQTIKPRWGALTFSYLNDGNKPSVFHTLYTIFTSPHSKYSGLYVDERGAPKSLAQARAWDEIWKVERMLKPCDNPDHASVKYEAERGYRLRKMDCADCVKENVNASV